LEWTVIKTKLPHHKDEGEMKTVAEAKSGVVGVPVVVQPVPIHHDLATVLKEIRDIQVAVLVLHEMYGTSSVPLPFEYSRSCIVFGIVMP
jgi:hypothetical protein